MSLENRWRVATDWAVALKLEEPIWSHNLPQVETEEKKREKNDAIHAPWTMSAHTLVMRSLHTEGHFSLNTVLCSGQAGPVYLQNRSYQYKNPPLH